jgi:putative CocE/NonD family hydrolase
MNFWSLEPLLFVVSAAIILAVVGGALWVYFQVHLYVLAWGLNLPPPKNRVKINYNVVIPMPDGVSLVADIYRPKDKGSYPAVLIRTPYAKEKAEHNYSLVGNVFSSQGYVVVIQDVRGKYGSEGVFTPFVNEAKDGRDTVEWMAKQHWSDGKVAAWGFSYLGQCTWLIATDAPKPLKTIIPMFCCQNAYKGWISSGVPYLKDMIMWLALHHGRQGKIVTHEEIDELVFRLPVLQYDKRIKEGIDTFRTWMSHLHIDDYWLKLGVSDKRDRISVPVLFVVGWYDRFVNNTIEDFQKTVAINKDNKVGKSRLVIGPWGHEPIATFPDVNYGYYSKFKHQFVIQLRWLDYWLNGANNDLELERPIEYF